MESGIYTINGILSISPIAFGGKEEQR
jgi:hypothetical protein